jgi:hypothetical protein
MVIELYRALRAAGVDETLAMEAANAVLPAGNRSQRPLDTSALKTDFAKLERNLIMWNVGTMTAMTVIDLLINAALRFLLP